MSRNAPVGGDSCGWGAARARVKRREERVVRYFMAVGVVGGYWKRENSFVYMYAGLYVTDSRALYSV